MSARVSRRGFFETGRRAALLGLIPPAVAAQAPHEPKPWWPQQDPEIVKETVGAAHGNLPRLRELVERQPALANATIDWGFGDWEDALGGASHVGRRDIAEFLLASGARPSIFSAAMLGQLDVVRGLVAAQPGIQRTRGPHGIPLLAHARAGGAPAAAVVAYLETLGDAGVPVPTVPITPADRESLLGRYRFGPGARDYFDVDVQNDRLGMVRPGTTRRFLFPTGPLAFFPAGVPSVRIEFVRASGRITELTVADPDVYVTAVRE
jgi:hypothetical protein